MHLMRKTRQNSTVFAIIVKENYSNSSTIYCLFVFPPKESQQNYLEILREKVITAKDDRLVVEVFIRQYFEVTFSAGFVLSFQIMSKHFKMYIKIKNIIGEKSIDLVSLLFRARRLPSLACLASMLITE